VPPSTPQIRAGRCGQAEPRRAASRSLTWARRVASAAVPLPAAPTPGTSPRASRWSWTPPKPCPPPKNPARGRRWM